MAERGILFAHTTILRWVQRYVPDFEKRWLAYALPVGDSWRVDESYIKVQRWFPWLSRALIGVGSEIRFSRMQDRVWRGGWCPGI
jgi:transposase-like protein